MLKCVSYHISGPRDSAPSIEASFPRLRRRDQGGAITLGGFRSGASLDPDTGRRFTRISRRSTSLPPRLVPQVAVPISAREGAIGLPVARAQTFTEVCEGSVESRVLVESYSANFLPPPDFARHEQRQSFRGRHFDCPNDSLARRSLALSNDRERAQRILGHLL